MIKPILPHTAGENTDSVSWLLSKLWPNGGSHAGTQFATRLRALQAVGTANPGLHALCLEMSMLKIECFAQRTRRLS